MADEGQEKPPEGGAAAGGEVSKEDAKAAAKAEKAKAKAEKSAAKAARKAERTKQKRMAKARRSKAWNAPLSKDGAYIYAVKMLLVFGFLTYVVVVSVFFVQMEK